MHNFLQNERNLNGETNEDNKDIRAKNIICFVIQLFLGKSEKKHELEVFKMVQKVIDGSIYLDDFYNFLIKTTPILKKTLSKPLWCMLRECLPGKALN